MTIAEIESTLRTLCIRHQNLDDELLTTLLTAGGWEDKIIKDALSLYRSSPDKYKPSQEALALFTKQQGVVVNKIEAVPPVVAVPSESLHVAQTSDQVVSQITAQVPTSSDMVYYTGTGEEEKEIPIVIESVEIKKDAEEPLVKMVTESHIQDTETGQLSAVLQDNLAASLSKQVIVNNDPQSLITPPLEQRAYVQSEPPANLPLKPFESAPHVWPFSKYKEVFHGEVMTPLPADERALVNEIKTSTQEVPAQTPAVPLLAKKVKIKRTGFDGEDEGLIFLTATTLLIILLLLAYMYSNGRI